MSTPPDLGPLPEHPEPRTMQWTTVEREAIRDFGQRCYMLGVAAASQWRPIETAPKDKPLLLWNPSYGYPVVGHILAGDLWGTFTPGVPMLFQKHIEAPTHWMPLPSAPTKEGG